MRAVPPCGEAWAKKRRERAGEGEREHCSSAAQPTAAAVWLGLGLGWGWWWEWGGQGGTAALHETLPQHVSLSPLLALSSTAPPSGTHRPTPCSTSRGDGGSGTVQVFPIRPGCAWSELTAGGRPVSRLLGNGQSAAWAGYLPVAGETELPRQMCLQFDNAGNQAVKARRSAQGTVCDYCHRVDIKAIFSLFM